MARCKGCIHTDVCNREVGYGYAECPHYKSDDVVPRASYDALVAEREEQDEAIINALHYMKEIREETAREIFAEIENSPSIVIAGLKHYIICERDFDELKKKYTDIEKLVLIERFESLLMDEFLKRCNYNDFGKLDLLTIGEVVEVVRSRMEEKLWEGSSE